MGSWFSKCFRGFLSKKDAVKNEEDSVDAKSAKDDEGLQNRMSVANENVDMSIANQLRIEMEPLKDEKVDTKSGIEIVAQHFSRLTFKRSHKISSIKATLSVYKARAHLHVRSNVT